MMRNLGGFFLSVTIGAFFSASAGHAEWSRFSLQDGRFSILLPSRPEEISAPSQADLLPRAYQAKFGCVYFTVNSFESSNSTIPIQSVVDKLLSQLGGQTQNEVVEISGAGNDYLPMIKYSADFSREGNEFLIRGSIIGDGRKAYQFYSLRQVSCDDQGTVDKFLSSFNLVPVK
jgi:hypothetical protein